MKFFKFRIIVLCCIMLNITSLYSQNIRDKIKIKSDSIRILRELIIGDENYYSRIEQSINQKCDVSRRLLDSLKACQFQNIKMLGPLKKYNERLIDSLNFYVNNPLYSTKDLGINYNYVYSEEVNRKDVKIIFFNKRTLKPFVYFEIPEEKYGEQRQEPRLYFEYDETGSASGCYFVNGHKYLINHGRPIGDFMLPLHHLKINGIDDKMGRMSWVHDNTIISGKMSSEGHFNDVVWFYSFRDEEEFSIDFFNKMGYRITEKINSRWPLSCAVRFNNGIPLSLLTGNGIFLEFNQNSQISLYKKYFHDSDLGYFLTDSISLLSTEGILLFNSKYYKYIRNKGHIVVDDGVKQYKIGGDYDSPYFLDSNFRSVGDPLKELYRFLISHERVSHTKIDLERIILNEKIYWSEFSTSFNRKDEIFELLIKKI